VQHPVVRTSEAVLRQNPIGIADEIAIGEEQKLDQVVAVAAGGGPIRKRSLTGSLDRCICVGRYRTAHVVNTSVGGRSQGLGGPGR
jgi:hypothetical protein